VTEDRVYLLTSRGNVRLPTPPPMHNRGNFTASLCEIVRWLGEKAEGLGVNLFPGFPARSLLVEGRRVVGVRTEPSGLGRDGRPRPGKEHVPSSDVAARVTVLCEGARGPLTQAWLAWQGIGSPNPQIYALGVKELWEVPSPPPPVMHTLGWPLPRDAFGGSWLYPMGDGLVSLGLVVGLDYRQSALDVHLLLQQLKQHSLVRPHLEGGQMVEWGAKIIPEGGYFSLPERLHGEGLLLAGDAAGLVDVPSLKGIHYAMKSGVLAARAVWEALRAGQEAGGALAGYDRALRESFVAADLRRSRNMRLVFKSGFWSGGVKAGLAALTGGALPPGRVRVPADAEEPREAVEAEAFVPDGRLTFSKLDAVFRSGNATRDDIPSHLLAGEEVPPEVAAFYQSMCPAGVYEVQGGKLVINAPNCVDCRTTDVLGPRWTVREGGAGPRYQRM